MKHLLLCLVVPGYRRLRGGDKRWALLLQAAFVLLVLVGVPLARNPIGLGIFLGALAVLIGLSFLGGGEGPPARLTRAEWGFLIVPQCVVVLCLAVPWLRREAVGLQVYKMASGSMTPTLAPGDRFVVGTCAVTPARGDLVVFRAPDRPDATYVKRIAGLPGDELHGIRVPPGCVFVVGDNTVRSRDSRHFGPVRIDAITGRPLYVVWADAWQRIGTSLGKSLDWRNLRGR